MKIGIYKPFKIIYFHDNTIDYAGWSFEVTQLAKIFANHHHDVRILSQTDLKKDDFSNISVGSLLEQYDRIFIFCGYFANDKKIIEQCRKITKRLDFVMTDLRLNAYRYDLFDNIYDQKILIAHKYNGIPELATYQHNFANLQKNIEAKHIEYCFGGGERNRLNDFLEYVWRPDCVLYAQSYLLSFDNRINHSLFLKRLQSVKYSIVIADEEYNKDACVTPRYYENVLADVIAFVDYKYDKNEKYIKQSDWRRVKSYHELKLKMNFLNDNHKDYIDLLKKQRAEIKTEYVTGEYTYNLLK